MPSPSALNKLKTLLKAGSKDGSTVDPLQRSLDEALMRQSNEQLPAVIPSSAAPAVVTPAGPAIPPLTNSAAPLTNMSRRKFLKSGAAQVASNALDVSPVGALTKIATDPAALQAIANAAPVVARLSPLDRNVLQGLWWTVGEVPSEVLRPESVSKFFNHLYNKSNLRPSDRKRLDAAMKEAQSIEDPNDQFNALHSAFSDLPLNALLPEEIIRASDLHLEPGNFSRMSPEQRREWLDALIEEGDEDYTPSEKAIRNTLNRLFGG